MSTDSSSTADPQRPDDPDRDFTLAHYREIVRAITRTHRTFSFGEAAPLGRDLLSQGRFVLMRHDIEFSLEAAQTIAEADHDAGIRSTFFLQLGSDYNLFEHESAEIVQRILDLGHDIGLHYDVALLRRSGGEPSGVARRMIDLMESFWSTRIHAASPHLPMRSGGRLEIPGVVDAYDPLYFVDIKYLSDSTQRWREGVVTKLLDRYDQIQLLTHEYHWSDEGHGFDVLLLREAMKKYRVFYDRAEQNIVRFRQGLRLRAVRDAQFRELVGTGTRVADQAETIGPDATDSTDASGTTNEGDGRSPLDDEKRSAIRATRDDDLPAISDLTGSIFGRRRSLELLRWLLLSRGEGLGLESMVVEQDGRIVGHVGAIRSRYRLDGETHVAAHPLLWMAEPAVRGRISVQLGGWCGSRAEWTLVLGGTPDTQAILKRRKFEQEGTARELRIPLAEAVALTLAGPNDSTVELVAYEAQDDPSPQAPERGDLPIVNLADPPLLRWLADSPEVETKLFTVMREGEALGPALFYVNRASDPPSGRIVHLPWVEDGWEDVLAAALRFLADAGCASATLLTTWPALLDAALRFGGEVFYERPLWARHWARPLGGRDWHLTYLEGDLAYRNV